MHDYYYTKEKHTPPVYFQLPIHLLEDHYKQGSYFEDCEEAIQDVRILLIEYGADKFTLLWHLADSHDNQRLWQLYMQVIGIDGATTGLLENALQALLQVSDDFIFTNADVIETIEGWDRWHYPSKVQ